MTFSRNPRILFDVEPNKETPKESITQVLANTDLYGVVDPVGLYEQALGRLSIEFSYLHFMLEKISWELWRLDPTVGSIITKDLRTSHLVEKLLASADKVIPPTHTKEFCALMKRAGKIATTRNEWLHQIWVLNEGEPVVCVSRKHGILKGNDVPSLEELALFNLSILGLAGELADFEKAHIP